jgi:hypothetical protein
MISGEMDNIEVRQGLTELRQKIENFKEKIAKRSQLLILAYNFFLHYEEVES